ncbi:MAG TPA: hypothetical protein VGN47_09115 [Blastococcus sp.]|jgi:hypothetical protein|nr:hypothetical protein [Blastococcus sp.]
MLAVRRSAVRGALVGVGLLVATGAGSPAALADETPSPEVPPPHVDPHVAAAAPAVPLNPAPAPVVGKTQTLAGDFGLGKAGTIVVQPAGDVPNDLDRSGATLIITGGGITATCTTDAAGVCAVSVTNGAIVTDGMALQLPPGNYEVRQQESSPGLQADVDDYWTLNLCQTTQMSIPGAPGTPPIVLPVPCSSGGTGTVPDAALFRRHLTSTVVGAGAPLAGATYALAGPDYPHVPAVRGADGIHRDTATTGTDGVLSYAGWFMPGQWTLTPATVLAGYDKGAPATVVVPDAAPASDTVSGAEIVLTRPGAGGGTGDPGTGTGDPGTPPQAPVPAPAAAVPPAGHPSPAAHRLPAPRVVVPQIPVLVPAPPTLAPAPVVPTPEAAPSDVVAGPRVPSPHLAPASSSYVEAGAIGVGILLVAFAVIGVGVLRRRARG